MVTGSCWNGSWMGRENWVVGWRRMRRCEDGETLLLDRARVGL